MILVKAGLGLDVNTLLQMGITPLKLACIPCISEAMAAAGMACWVLNFSFWFGASLGFVLGAVSPALVVLSLLDLESRGYGVKKGIPSLIIAAASMDDVLAISAFALTSSLAFAELGLGGGSDHTWTIMKAPVQLIGGCLIGFFLGKFFIR